MATRTVLVAGALTLCAGLPVAADDLLVSSYLSGQVGRFDRSTGAAIGALAGTTAGPQCAILGPDGKLYISCEIGNNVQRFDADTYAFIDTFVTPGSGGLNGPNGLAFDKDGNLLVCSFNSDQVLKYDGLTGAPIGVFVAAGSGGLNGPDNGLTFGPDGHLYIPSFYGHAVLKYDGQTGASLGAFVPAGSGGLTWPRGMAFRPDGLYVASSGSGSVVRFDRATGASLGTFVSGSGLVRPVCFGWDSAGRMLVVDDVSNNIRRFLGGTGAFLDVLIPAGGGLSGPTYARPVPRPQFTEAPQFGTGNTIAVAWGDWNLDDRPDLVVAAVGGSGVRLYTNNGNGTFTPSSPFGISSSFAAVWGDVNNDGRPDLVVAGYNAVPSVCINNGDGTFTRQLLPGPALRGIALALGDADNDGDLDIAAGNGILGVSQQNYLYTNNGNGTWTETPQFGFGQTDSVAWGDFDNDGDLDLAVGRGGYQTAQQSHLYINNGNGTFTERAEFGFADTASVSWADFDNDGDLDLAVGNWGGDPSKLYVNNGDGSFSGRREFGSRDTNTVAWGDYNNDGFLDLACGNGDFTSADQNFLYVNNGDLTFSQVPAFGLGSTDSLAFADADGDGRLDVAAGNEHSPATNYLYTNADAGPRWLELRLVGHRHDLGTGYSNRDAIGARVWVYAAGHMGQLPYLRGYRQIVANGGFTSQNWIVEHIGLPMDTSVDVRILWPGSGGTRLTQEVLGVAIGQRITIQEQGACYPNCDASTAPPVLNVLDFGCFLNKFAAGDPYANCDHSTTSPVLNVLDFGCFLNAFAAGCP